MLGHKFSLFTNILKPLIKDIIDLCKNYGLKKNKKENSED